MTDMNTVHAVTKQITQCVSTLSYTNNIRTNGLKEVSICLTGWKNYLVEGGNRMFSLEQKFLSKEQTRCEGN